MNHEDANVLLASIGFHRDIGVTLHEWSKGRVTLMFAPPRSTRDWVIYVIVSAGDTSEPVKELMPALAIPALDGRVRI